ncbi:Formin-like protein 14 [Abeliophyllum distichum]|uniref:Formin-like protein n=1 Tax=Abeliophyllum distichum TaxID=126358 RepID=A0ABD1Q7Q2_9LAMI
MTILSRFFYKRPPDGLLELSDRVYVFDSCFSTEVLPEGIYQLYLKEIITDLHEEFPDSSFLAFNFREGQKRSQFAEILCEYDVTVMDYPRQYEGCPLLPLSLIHHFLRVSESWLSLGNSQNVVLLHCERGGWLLLTLVLASFLVYRKLHSGERKTLEMVYREGPKGLLQLLSPLNPFPSQLRYLQYISRRNISPEWPPPERALSLDCLIFRAIPRFDNQKGCRPIVRIFGRNLLGKDGLSTQMLYSMHKKGRHVRHYRQKDNDVIKIDIQCLVQGDVVLECVHLDLDPEREVMMFRTMFNTAFIRSNILMLNSENLDILWDSKARFPKGFRAEVLFGDVDSRSPPKAPTAILNGEDHGGLPIEAFSRVQELFGGVDWVDSSDDATLWLLKQFSALNDVKDLSILRRRMSGYSSPFDSEEENNASSVADSLDFPDSERGNAPEVSFLDDHSSPDCTSDEASDLKTTADHMKPSMCPARSPGTDGLFDTSVPTELLNKIHYPGTETSSNVPPPVQPTLPSFTVSVTTTPELPLPPATPLLDSSKCPPPSAPPALCSSKIHSQPHPINPGEGLFPPPNVSSKGPPPPAPPPPPPIVSSKIPPPPPPPPPPTINSSKVPPPLPIPSTEGPSFPPPFPPPHISSNKGPPPSPLLNSSKVPPPPTPPPPPPPPPPPLVRFGTGPTPPPPSLPPSDFSEGTLPPTPPLPLPSKGPLTSSPLVSSKIAAPPPPPPPPLPPPPISNAKRPVPPPPGGPLQGSIPPGPAQALEPPKAHPPLPGRGSAPPPPPPLPGRGLTPAPPPPPPGRGSAPPPPPPPPGRGSAPAPPPPPPPPGRSSAPAPPPPPPPPGRSSAPAPPPPPPGRCSAPAPPPPPPGRGSAPTPPPPPPGHSSAPVPPSLPGGKSSNEPPPPPPSIVRGRVMSGSTSHGRGRGFTGSSIPPKKTSLKPLHWVKVTRAVQGSLWADSQKQENQSRAPEIDISELESLFSVASASDGANKVGGQRGSKINKPEKVQLVDLRRAYNCEIMLTKVKIPLPDMINAILALDSSALDIDQVENLIKFCPTKEEMETLKNYNGDKEMLGKCEQFFLELMKVPRVEAKLRVFAFTITFSSQVKDLKSNLNTISDAAREVKESLKLRQIMQTILTLGNALNQGTARGSAVGFKLDSLLKLSDTRARNNKMTLMHYLSKVVAEKMPELLDFVKDLVHVEPASKIQLKSLAEEMQAVSKGLEKVEQELTASENDGAVSLGFRKVLKSFLDTAEAEVRSLIALYSEVGRNADSLSQYFGEDPARCPFEQVTQILVVFTKMFNKARDENEQQADVEKKKLEKEALKEQAAANSPARKEGVDALRAKLNIRNQKHAS